MTVRDVLNLMDHEVWVRIRPETPESKADVVFFSADWHGGAHLPKQLDKYLDWYGDDLFVEMFKNPEGKGKVPMLVICAYNTNQLPETFFVLNEICMEHGEDVSRGRSRAFMEKECARAAMRDSWNSEIDALGDGQKCDNCYLGLDTAYLHVPGKYRIEWSIQTLETEDESYK